MDQDSKTAIKRIASMALPIDKWLADPARKFNGKSKWRDAGATPSIHDLNIVEKLEDILDKDDPDLAVANRWRKRSEEPLAVQKDLLDRRRWRATRKDKDKHRLLESEAVFGVASSGNFVLTVEEERDGRTVTLPFTRKELYAVAVPALLRVVTARRLLDAGTPQSAWDRLLEDMLNTSGMADWPLKQPTALEFLRQLTRECLELALGMERSNKNPFREAMPKEAGESRRPGQGYTVPEVKAATDAAKAALGI